MGNEQPEARSIPIKLVVPDGIEAVYSNFMQVTYTPYEFVITFARIAPVVAPTAEFAEAKAVSQILVPHQLMPKIVKILQENLSKFEEAIVSVA